MRAIVENHALFHRTGAAQAPLSDRRDVDAVVASPVRRTVQPDGRIRHWGPVRLANEAKERILRVVTLADGETLHNAFIDRDFTEDQA